MPEIIVLVFSLAPLCIAIWLLLTVYRVSRDVGEIKEMLRQDRRPSAG